MSSHMVNPGLSTDTVANAVPPWKRSWFYCAPGEMATQGWVIGLHVVSLVGLILLPLPPVGAVAIAIGLIFMGGLGTTVCYHRALAHRALTLHPVVREILIFFAVLNGSGNPQSWVAMHRLHHATSDHADDISSPHHGGFWWAHLRWLWQADQRPSQRFAKDLNTVGYRFWHRAQIPMFALSTFGGLLYLAPEPLEALAAALWIGPLRLLWALHAQCTINSICHLGIIHSEGGSSRNVWWLAPIHMGQGENWHANHHQRQVDPQLGHGFFQVDIGWWVIRGLCLARLATCRGA